MSGPDLRHPLVTRLLDRCTFPPPGEPARCAVSGGADSTALAVLAAAAGCVVECAHVDHGLRPGSGDEADLVAGLARALGASFISLRVEVADGPDLERRARDARRGVLGPGTLYGHTADDQAESVLLALLRGAGPTGLAGIAPEGHPILDLRRRETEALCAALELPRFDDPTNGDLRFRRNRVRHEVLPLLCDVAERDVVPLLVRAARHQRDVTEVLTEAATAVDPTDAAALRRLPRAIAAEAVRGWWRGATGSPYAPDAAAVDRILDVAALRIEATEVAGGWRVERHQGRLSLRLGP